MWVKRQRRLSATQPSGPFSIFKGCIQTRVSQKVEYLHGLLRRTGGCETRPSLTGAANAASSPLTDFLLDSVHLKCGRVLPCIVSSQCFLASFILFQRTNKRQWTSTCCSDRRPAGKSTEPTLYVYVVLSYKGCLFCLSHTETEVCMQFRVEKIDNS